MQIFQAIKNIINKANGICPLDSSSKVPASNLPEKTEQMAEVGAITAEYETAWGGL